mmetsp:Transcript_21454/g.63312  ORF Transcript_21454/g.63312 Transcript_21454/m.63312 type:complete len:256 (+) Transcript_21454:973-1740(+)
MVPRDHVVPVGALEHRVVVLALLIGEGLLGKEELGEDGVGDHGEHSKHVARRVHTSEVNEAGGQDGDGVLVTLEEGEHTQHHVACTHPGVHGVREVELEGRHHAARVGDEQACEEELHADEEAVARDHDDLLAEYDGNLEGSRQRVRDGDRALRVPPILAVLDKPDGNRRHNFQRSSDNMQEEAEAAGPAQIVLGVVREGCVEANYEAVQAGGQEGEDHPADEQGIDAILGNRLVEGTRLHAVLGLHDWDDHPSE